MSKRPAQSLTEGPELKMSKIDKDDRLILLTSPITLKEMAAVRIALALWYHEDVRHLNGTLTVEDSSEDDVEEEEEYSNDGYGGWDDYDSYDLEEEESFDEDGERMMYFLRPEPRLFEVNSLASLDSEVKKSIDKLPIPTAISSIIENYVLPIRIEMVLWGTYHYKRVFFHLSEKLVNGYLDEIVWKPDGTVNYKMTAKQMLRSPRLSDVEKYRFMCTYCLEEEIRNLSPLMFTNMYIERLPFDEHPLICYWNAVMTGKLDKLAVGFDSAEVRVIRMENVGNEYAIKYLLDRLSDESKVNEARFLLVRYDVKYQTILLNGLNEVQQQHIFMDMAPQIIKSYAFEKGQLEFALSTWIHIRYLVTENQFVQIFKPILTHALEVRTRNCDIFSLLVNMWKTAPDELRQYALNNQDGEIVNKLLVVTKQNFDLICELLTTMLSDASVDYRSKVIQSTACLKLCEVIIQYSRPYLVDQFIKVCLLKNDDAINFKKGLMTTNAVRKHCVCLCKTKKMDELTEFLTTYLPNAQDQADFKAQILTFDDGVYAYIQNLAIPGYVSMVYIDHEAGCANDEERLSFLTNMMYNAGDAVREVVIKTENCRQLCEIFILQSCFVLLDFLVKLCLPKDAVTTFKMELMHRKKIKNYCLDLVEKEEWQKMNQFLELHLPDVAVAVYKAALLFSDLGVSICSRKFTSNTQTNCAFLSQMLSKANATTKKALILLPCCARLIEILITSSHLATLDYLVKLCLPNDEAVEFKKQFTQTKSTEDHFLTLFANGNFVKINEFISTFLPEPTSANEYKTRLLNSARGIQICIRKLNPSTFRSLNSDIDKMLRDAYVAKEFKKKIIMSDLVVQRFQEWVAQGRCNDVSNCVNYFLPDGADLKILKERIFNFYRAESIKNIFIMFDVNQWQQLLLWCLGNEQKIAEFKRTLLHHNIFILLLKEAFFVVYDRFLRQCCFRRPPCVVPLDRFLQWYFVTVEEVKKFKLQQIRDYANIDVICTLLRKKDSSYLKSVLDWFFGGDVEQIRIFKEKNPRCRFLNLI